MKSPFVSKSLKLHSIHKLENMAAATYALDTYVIPSPPNASPTDALPVPTVGANMDAHDALPTGKRMPWFRDSEADPVEIIFLMSGRCPISQGNSGVCQGKW